jgi:DNA primase large subunit
MSETKFTPGPWSNLKPSETDASEFVDLQFIGVVDRDFARLAAVHFGSGPASLECTANAKLIAAAPDLYAALKDLDEAFCSENRTKEDRFRSRQALIAARAALAKARGES